MAERVAGNPERAVQVVSSAWWSPHAEAAFVIRSIAGALSRHADVEVVAPTAPPGGGPVTADGLFDVRTEPRPDLDPALVVVVADDAVADALVRSVPPSTPVVVVGDGGPAGDRGRTRWTPGAATADGAVEIGLHVAINPLARDHPHNGFGFTDYLLVLTDRGGARRADDDPTDVARWLAAAFPGHDLVVVESATATAWRGRTLRGAVTVDTRTDLWRLVAHARAVVDLRPGPLVARECVEALRYGTPVIVPTQTAAARLAARGGGLAFGSVDQLFECVDRVDDPAGRAALSAEGRAATDSRYGDAGAFVGRVGAALASSAVAE